MRNREKDLLLNLTLRSKKLQMLWKILSEMNSTKGNAMKM
jgi:hypothetical protein